MKLSMKVTLGLVLGVLVVAAGTFVLAEFFFGKHDVPAEEAKAMWQSRAPAFIEVLEEKFPDRYASLIEGSRVLMIDMPEGAQLDEALSQIQSTIFEKIADEHEALARRAPDPALRNWMEAVARSIQDVYLQGDASLCGAFIDSGPSAFAGSAVADLVAPSLDMRDAALLMALAEARDTAADPMAPASQADWAELNVAMSRDDVPQSYAKALDDADSAHPDYCPALVLLFNKIETMAGEAGQRLRAEYLANSFE